MRDGMRHSGWALVETPEGGVVVPLRSWYVRRDQAERVAWDRVAALAGATPSDVALMPASRDEATREEVERLAADLPGEWAVAAPVDLVPGEAPETEAAAPVPGLDEIAACACASDAILLCEAHGRRAAYAKGGTLWVSGSASDDLSGCGLRWSARRGAWYREDVPAGTAAGMSKRQVVATLAA